MARIVVDLAGPSAAVRSADARRSVLGGLGGAGLGGGDGLVEEAKGTKDVDVPLSVIPDLPGARPGATVGSLGLRPGRGPRVAGDGPLSSTTSGDAGADRRAADLVTRHGPRLHRYLSRMVPGDRAVEDCLHVVLTLAAAARPVPRGDAETRAWLFTLAHRATRTARRAAPTAGSADGPGATGPAEAGLLRDLDAGLRRLPEGQRAVWLLTEVEDLTRAQVATVLGVDQAVVTGDLTRARAALSAALSSHR